MLKIGKVELKNNLILAPMAGYGDIAFRQICKYYGAGLTVTEMISCKGLLYDNDKTKLMLRTFDGETPCSVQLFGSEPQVFYDAITKCEELEKFDIIDINMGCPVNKVTKSGEGSALLKNVSLAKEIVSACVEASARPVSVKMRTGYTNQDNAVNFALAMQESGASMITVHGRTTSQLYSGFADWDKISQVKQALTIPVVGSGDVNLDNYKEREKLVDGLMIGRGAIGHPDIFARILGKKGDDTLSMINRHLDYLQEYFDEHYIVVSMRKHLAYYLKGKVSKSFKNELNYIDNLLKLREKLAINLHTS